MVHLGTMGDDDVSKLEPPRLFGRGRGPKTRPVEPEERPTQAPASEPIAPPMSEPVVPPAPEPVVPPAPEPVASPMPAAPEPVVTPEPRHAKAAATPEATAPAAGEPSKRVKEKRPKAAKPKRTRPAKPPKAPRERRRLPRLRRPAELVSVALVGLVSGAALAGLTWAFIQADPGEHLTFVYVVLVFVVAVTIGWLVLRLLGVRSPGTIAFLGTGIVAMVAICIGSGPLDTLGGAIGVIVGSVPAYALSGWVTQRFIDAA